MPKTKAKKDLLKNFVTKCKCGSARFIFKQTIEYIGATQSYTGILVAHDNRDEQEFEAVEYVKCYDCPRLYNPKDFTGLEFKNNDE